MTSAAPAGRWRVALALAGTIGLGLLSRLRPVGWLVGTTFAWHDVACYVVGVAAAFALDRTLLRPGRLPPGVGAS
jgi:hypothetical protein